MLAATLLLSGCAVVVVGGAATAGSVAHDRRSVGAMIDDQGIEMGATNRLYDHEAITRDDRIKVISHNAIVLLAGEVSSADKIELASRIVSGIKDVRRVVNELLVAPAGGIGTRSRDIYLTSRVKTALFGVDIDGFDPTRVNVTTAHDVVYLMGLVTRREGQAAAEKARRVGGVKQVVKVFEYLDEPPAPDQSRPGDTTADPADTGV